MKRHVAFAAFFCAVSAGAATVDQVIVRQQWPWSTDVKVEWRISGVTGPVDINVRAFDGEEEVNPSDLFASITGARYGVTSSSGYFIIDPVKALGKSKISTSRFRVSLSLSDSPANLDEALYRIYNLQSPYDVTNVTRKALLNGEWGDIVTDFSKIGDGFNTTLDDVIIWTAVTNDVKYKTTHLVMRKIPAAGKVWKIGSPSGEKGRGTADVDETRYDVKLMQDYYIAVFEITQAQYKKYAGYTRTPANVGDLLPMESDHYQSLRGNGGGQLDPYGERVNWPTNSHLHTVYASSDLGCLRAKFDGLEFDLPTEAQWEFACRAGTTNALNSGKEVSTSSSYYWQDDSENFNELGWCSLNSGSTTQVVGLKKPNAFGLYDMHGNVGEACVNWCGAVNAGQESANVIIDPLGPTEGLGGCRSARGGGINQPAAKNRSASRIQIGPTTAYSYVGFRFVCPVGKTW